MTNITEIFSKPFAVIVIIAVVVASDSVRSGRESGDRLRVTVLLLPHVRAHHTL